MHVDGSSVRVAVITNIIPHYREDFWRRVFDQKNYVINVFCQSEIPGMDLDAVNDHFPRNVSEVGYHALKSERLVWQKLPFQRIKRNHDVFVFTGNPRVLSTLVFSTYLRLTGHPVVIWGQLHTAGAGMYFERLRLLWWRRFRYYFLYTEYEVGEMLSRGWNIGVSVSMNNGLDQSKIDAVRSTWDKDSLLEWRIEHGLGTRPILLSCARIEKKNQLDLVLNALLVLRKTHPDLLWCVIGDGSMGDRWKSAGQSLGLSEHIRWLGEIYTEEELAPWFMSADVFVHPGAIGLSLMHAFGYALPVVTHSNKSNQMPEASVIRHRENAALFAEKDTGDLARVLGELLDNETLRSDLGAEAERCVREKYNTRIMAERFFELLAKVVKSEASCNG